MKKKKDRDEPAFDMTEEDFPELEPVPPPVIPYQVIININLAPGMSPGVAFPGTAQPGACQSAAGPDQDVQGLCHYGGPTYGKGCTRVGGYKCARCGLRG